MKIEGTQTTIVSVDVSPRQILQSAVAIIRRNAQILESDFLSEGKIKYDDPDHRHGSIQELVRREATPEDVEAFAAIAYLNNLIRNQ